MIFRKSVRALIVVLVLLLAAAAANAASFTYSGTTVGGPTWDRPGMGTPPSYLSYLGVDVPYDVFAFRVDVSGAYNLTTLTSVYWDDFFVLYQFAFDPLAPLANAVVAEDVNGYGGIYGIGLTAGRPYFLVTTGYETTFVGAFTNTISGPGRVTELAAVPEPATLLLLGTGVLATAGRAWRRRRR